MISEKIIQEYYNMDDTSWQILKDNWLKTIGAEDLLGLTDYTTVEIAKRIVAPLTYFCGSVKEAKVWLNTPNPEFDNMETPLEVIKNGEGEVIVDMFEGMIMGSYS